MILSLVLSVLTSCTTTEVTDQSDFYIGTLISMIPKLPEVPALPQLYWTYKDGLYCLDEDNVNKLLNYGENTLPLFIWEMQQYQRKMEIILQSL